MIFMPLMSFMSFLSGCPLGFLFQTFETSVWNTFCVHGTPAAGQARAKRSGVVHAIAGSLTPSRMWSLTIFAVTGASKTPFR
jgi:hypothetical protein